MSFIFLFIITISENASAKVKTRLYMQQDEELPNTAAHEEEAALMHIKEIQD